MEGRCGGADLGRGNSSPGFAGVLALVFAALLAVALVAVFLAVAAWVRAVADFRVVALSVALVLGVLDFGVAFLRAVAAFVAGFFAGIRNCPWLHGGLSDEGA